METSCAKLEPKRNKNVENTRKTLFILVREEGVSLHRFSQRIQMFDNTKWLSFTPNFKEMAQKLGGGRLELLLELL